VISVLDLVGVGLSIGGKPILHDLNLHVVPGEIHAILGMNGTGKSTLASVIMGLSGFAPTSGSVVFQGEDITSLSISGRAKRGITLAWQEPARFEGLTVKEYLELGKQRILDAVRILARNGASVLLITHQNEIAVSADRASSLCGGTVLRTGDPVAIGRFFRDHCRECPHGNASPGEVLLHG